MLCVLLEHQWHCSAYNSTDCSSGLLALSGTIAEVSKDPASKDLLDPSSPGITYIYPGPMEEINCSGRVTAVEYCNRNDYAANNFDSNQLVFTLATLNHSQDQSGSVFIVVDTIKNIQHSDDRTCTSVRGSLIAVANQFKLPVSNLPVGLTISNLNVSLLGYRSNNLMNFDVTYYRSSVVVTIPYTNLQCEEGPLRLLKYHISKFHP